RGGSTSAAEPVGRAESRCIPPAKHRGGKLASSATPISMRLPRIRPGGDSRGRFREEKSKNEGRSSGHFGSTLGLCVRPGEPVSESGPAALRGNLVIRSPRRRVSGASCYLQDGAISIL